MASNNIIDQKIRRLEREKRRRGNVQKAHTIEVFGDLGKGERLLTRFEYDQAAKSWRELERGQDAT